MMQKQQGAGFLTWVSGLGVAILFFITAVKLVPVYTQFYAVQSLMDDIAADPGMKTATTMQVRRKIDDYLNINGIDGLSKDAFEVKPATGDDDTRELQVYYEVRKHWLANIDFMTTFEYSTILGKAGDS